MTRIYQYTGSTYRTETRSFRAGEYIVCNKGESRPQPDEDHKLIVSVQQHHLVFRSTSAIRQWLSSTCGVSSFFTSSLFAVGAVSTFVLAVGADVIRMVGSPDVRTE